MASWSTAGVGDRSTPAMPASTNRPGAHAKRPRWWVQLAGTRFWWVRAPDAPARRPREAPAMAGPGRSDPITGRCGAQVRRSREAAPGRPAGRPSIPTAQRRPDPSSGPRRRQRSAVAPRSLPTAQGAPDPSSGAERPGRSVRRPAGRLTSYSPGGARSVQRTQRPRRSAPAGAPHYLQPSGAPIRPGRHQGAPAERSATRAQRAARVLPLTSYSPAGARSVQRRPAGRPGRPRRRQRPRTQRGAPLPPAGRKGAPQALQRQALT